MATETQTLRRFRRILATTFSPNDSIWSYHVPGLPTAATLDRLSFIVSLQASSTRTNQQLLLTFERTPSNRITRSDASHLFLLLSIGNFRLQYPREPGDNNLETTPAPPRESADYLARLLHTGVVLNGVTYNFYGHSNSQLKSRSCLLYAASKTVISAKVEALGDFSKMKTVGKKAKRIGLLFSSAEVALEGLDPSRVEDIADVQTKDYCFTDGCGLVSPKLAQELARKRHIVHRGERYTPSVFQIRYRGYKGVLMVDPSMRNGETWVKMRESMRKFKAGEDMSFAVVEYSKPFTFGNLNDELILLLSALGITTEVLIKKQQANFDYYTKALTDPTTAFMFLTSLNQNDLAEQLLLSGIDFVRGDIKRLVNAEYNKLLNKREEQRCRILIPKSRLLFGICDPWGVLKPGECFVGVTAGAGGGEGTARPLAVTGCDVLVGRNPALHPGDVRKLRAVYKQELAHLVDCIVFSTKGKRPSADMMSGGDLDGDKFFVTWDKDIIPRIMSTPADYPGGREPIKFETITDADRVEYFARYTNASLGRVKNLFLDWARLKGPMCSECQQLNRLFSASVDGNRIKIPQTLESPPSIEDSPIEIAPFVLDELHDHSWEWIESRAYEEHLLETKSWEQLDGYTFDAIELLLARDSFAMSEFELFKLVYRWCLANDADIAEFLPYFDFAMIGTHEKAWILGLLPPTLNFPALVLNGLLQSSLVTKHELEPFKLHVQGMRWKRFYSSAEHRLGLLLEVLGRALSLFHKKLLILRVEERLSVAIYFPKKAEPTAETVVDDSVRLFAFTHSTDDRSSRHRLAVPTKKTYRLYYDNVSLQLYEGSRGNSWVYINKSQNIEDAYRNVPGKGDRRRARQATIEDGTNYDWRASIALDKFSKNLQRHIGRCRRNGIMAAEIYVISNRDILSQQLLDMWLEQIDTEETLPLFEKKAQEYKIPTIPNVEWADEEPWIRDIVRDKIYAAFTTFTTVSQFEAIFEFIYRHDERGRLGEVFDYLLLQFSLFGTPGAIKFSMRISTIFNAMVSFLSHAPYVAICFARLCGRANLPIQLSEALEQAATTLLTSLILMTNEISELVLVPFGAVLSIIRYMPLEVYAKLIETIALAVRFSKVEDTMAGSGSGGTRRTNKKSPELALNLLLEHLEPAAERILTVRPAARDHFVRNLLGLALEHLDTAADSKAKAKYLFQLRPTKKENHVITSLRIDAPRDDQPRVGDHVSLTVASSPLNAPVKRKYVMHAVVEAGAPGTATFRCIHPPPSYFEDCSWRLRNLGSFVTARTMIDAVVSFATKKTAVCGIYDLLLDLPVPDEEAVLNSALSNIWTESPEPEYRNPGLNDSQNQAVHAALTNRLVCLWGPPGTGKTHTIVVMLQELLRQDRHSRILVAAPTHNATDGVMIKFLAASQDLEEEIKPLRLSTDVHKVADSLKSYTCDAMVGKDLNDHPEARKKITARLDASRLVFTTCAGAGLGLLRTSTFTHAILDEASQQTEPASLIPLVKGCNRAVLVGDHVQLRASVTRHAQVEMFDVSLFERLYREHSGRGSVRKVMLDTQFRMHRDVCSFASRQFYDGKLQTGVKDDDRSLPAGWPEGKRRCVFVPCAWPEDRMQKSKSNTAQAAVCRHVVQRLRTTAAGETSTFTLAVLTPYTRQAELLRRQIPGETVSSIDAFQGREADVVVFVTVRCNLHRQLGFLTDLRRMNVALTRARCGYIVIGDKETLRGAEDDSSQVWGKLIDESDVLEVGVDEEGELLVE